MYIPIFSNLFSKNRNQLKKLDSSLVRQLKEYAKKRGYELFEDTNLYYRSNSIEVPLLLFIPNKGIILFEYKEWSFKELQGAKITKANNVEQTDTTLAFDRLHELIFEKYNDTTNKEDIAIYNFVLMEQLIYDEYLNLDVSFQEFLPASRVLFNDTKEEEFDKKFSQLQQKNPPHNKNTILPYIFSQYMVCDEQEKVFLATQEQREFVDTPLKETNTLYAPRVSGASTLLLQKAILKKLEEPQSNIAVVVPDTNYATKLKHHLITLVEEAILVIDLSGIAIITPHELLNIHRQKLKLPPQQKYTIEPQLLVKELHEFDTIFCDNSDFLPKDFLFYLHKQAQKSTLLKVTNQTDVVADFQLKHSFSGKSVIDTEDGFGFALKELQKNHTDNPATTTLIVAPFDAIDDIAEDIENFCGIVPVFYQAQKPNDIHPITIAHYGDMPLFHPDFIFFIDWVQDDKEQITHIQPLAKICNYVLKEKNN